MVSGFYYFKLFETIKFCHCPLYFCHCPLVIGIGMSFTEEHVFTRCHISQLNPVLCLFISMMPFIYPEISQRGSGRKPTAHFGFPPQQQPEPHPWISVYCYREGRSRTVEPETGESQGLQCHFQAGGLGQVTSFSFLGFLIYKIEGIFIMVVTTICKHFVY